MLNSILETIVIISSILVVYNLIIYPIAIILVSKFKTITSHRSLINSSSTLLPSVTFIIAAYNEQDVIEQKIRNTLDIDYPEELFEIIVVSDGSNDKTSNIVEKYRSEGVVGLHKPERRGKTAALNRAVKAAKGEIIVFSDANNDFNKDSVNNLVMHYNDKKIGGVCGLKKIKEGDDRESSEGDSLYWKYESEIKKAESNISSITCADGEIFSIRKELYTSIDESIINDDAEITFNIIKKGYRVLYETGARSYELASVKISDDFNVKVRMIAGGFQTLQKHFEFLFLKPSWFSFTFFSHKTLRYITPELLVVILMGSLFSINNYYFLAYLILQIIFYLSAYIGWLKIKQKTEPGIFYIPFYFTIMNIAGLLGFIRYITGNQSVNWKKAKR